MGYKILTGNSPHRRWIRFATLTHLHDEDYGVSFTESENPHFLSMRLGASGQEKQVERSYVSLDACIFLGREYEKSVDLIQRGKYRNVYIVGDLGNRREMIPNIGNLKLLYSQKYSNDLPMLHTILHGHGMYDGFAHGIFPSMFYAIKDCKSYPKKVHELFFSRKRLLLFAGQDGTDSIIKLFERHQEKTMEESLRRILHQSLHDLVRDILRDPSTFNAANLILNGTDEFINLIEETYYARRQEFLFEQRNTLIFKSVFRLIILKLLEAKNLLRLIKYPDEYLRIYNSRLYRRHSLLDFGGVNGYEMLYPRVADMVYNGLSYFQFNQREMQSCQQDASVERLAGFIDNQLRSIEGLRET